MNFVESEEKRISALKKLELLDTPPDESFDRITKLAQVLYDVPISYVSLVDLDRQWFKSCVGLSVKETPRTMSFCSHAILHDEVMVIEDAKKDERFSDNLLVTGEPFVRFYAGKPIRDPSNNKLGALCIIDKKPRKFTKKDEDLLTNLAHWVESEIQNYLLNKKFKKIDFDLREAKQILLLKNENLEEILSKKTEKLLNYEQMASLGFMASQISHDLNNSLSTIKMAASFLDMLLEDHQNEKIRSTIQRIDIASEKIEKILLNALDFASTRKLRKSKTSLPDLLNDSLDILDIPKGVTVSISKEDVLIDCDSKKMGAVFSNLIKNSIHAMNKSGKISISIKPLSDKVILEIQDSRTTPIEKNLEKIFESIFNKKQDETDFVLGISKTILEQHGATFSIKNNPNTFVIIFPKI